MAASTGVIEESPEIMAWRGRWYVAHINGENAVGALKAKQQNRPVGEKRSEKPIDSDAQDRREACAVEAGGDHHGGGSAVWHISGATQRGGVARCHL